MRIVKPCSPKLERFAHTMQFGLGQSALRQLLLAQHGSALRLKLQGGVLRQITQVPHVMNRLGGVKTPVAHMVQLVAQGRDLKSDRYFS